MDKDFSYLEVNEDMPFYTAEQTAAKLKIGKGRVYQLAKEGLIDAIETAFNSRVRKVYTKESVDRYYEKKYKPLPDGYLPIDEIAKLLDTTKIKIRYLLKSLTIPYEVKSAQGRRSITLIDQQYIETLKEGLEKNSTTSNRIKSEFVTKEGYGLYQVFKNKEGQYYRLVRNKETGVFGFYKNQNTFLSLQEALSDGFIPVYSATPIPLFEGGFAEFIFDKYELSTFEWIDFFYMNWGIRNMYISDVIGSNQIKVSLRVHTVTLTIEQTNTFMKSLQKVKCIKGNIRIEDNKILVNAGQRVFSTRLSDEAINIIEETAIRYGSISAALEEIIIQYKKRNHL